MFAKGEGQDLAKRKKGQQKSGRNKKKDGNNVFKLRCQDDKVHQTSDYKLTLQKFFFSSNNSVCLAFEKANKEVT